MGPIGSKVIEVKDQIYVFFSVGHVMSYLRLCVCVCLIFLHRRNHLTATSRRVKFTSIYNLNNSFHLQCLKLYFTAYGSMVLIGTTQDYGAKSWGGETNCYRLMSLGRRFP